MNNLNITCHETCEVINRPTYIVLFKGDDSDFTGNQTIYIDLNTELDLTGYKAYFRFMDYEQTYLDITSKRLILVFPAVQTSKFPLGAADASLVILDAQNRRRTINNRIHVVVTNSVGEAYSNEDPQSITVSVSGIFIQQQANWNEEDPSSPSYIQNKPEIGPGSEVDDHLDIDSIHPVQNKVITKALTTGFTEWNCDAISEGWEFLGCRWVEVQQMPPLTGWRAYVKQEGSSTEQTILFVVGSLPEPQHSIYDTELSFDQTSELPAIDLSRHLITPTRTSQLENDGSPNGDGIPYATTAQLANKLDGSAAYPAWDDMKDDYGAGDVVSFGGKLYVSIHGGNGADTPPLDSAHWAETTLQSLLALKQDALTPAQIGYISAVPSKANKVSGATAGNLAALDAQGNLADSGVKPSDFAAKADLPYALVTPGEWSLHSESYDVSTLDLPTWYASQGYWWIENEALTASGPNASNPDALSLEFMDGVITATRPSLPGHLLDRAVNAVSVSGDTTLTLPALVNADKARDLLVRLEISGSAVPTITFAAPTGETIVYETDGDEFPVPDEAGTWLYSFTETVAHKFAVSLKQLQSVSQPTQTQGGS